MNKILKQNLIEWNKKYDNYKKLQHIYVILLVTLVFTVGIINLFSLNYKSSVVEIAKILIITIIINFLSSNLAKVFIYDKIKK